MVDERQWQLGGAMGTTSVTLDMSSLGREVGFQMLLDGRNEVAMVSCLCQVK